MEPKKKKIKRDQVLYVRISREVRAWIKKEAKALGFSESEFIDEFVRGFRVLHEDMQKKVR